MIRKSIATVFKIGAAVVLLFVLLFIDKISSSPTNFISPFLREVAAIFQDSMTEWMVFLCLGIYFTALCFLRSRGESSSTQRHKDAKVKWWLIYVLLSSAVLYAVRYSPSTQALTLLGGAVIGQGVALWTDFNAKLKPLPTFRFPFLLIYLLAFMLALASVWQTEISHNFAYHGHARWSGPWDNPNNFGLLMGTGFSLALALGVGRWKMENGESKEVDKNWELKFTRYFCAFLCLLAATLTARGLFHSYSRGAWLATACGVAYLFWSTVRSPQSMVSDHSCDSRVSWLKNNWFSVGVILFSVVVLSFWQFRQANWHPARRAFSAVNAVDFSWRNRIAAWQSAMQITAEHPWFGTGWNQLEPLYEHYYLPSKLTESAAIQMNDYLMLGATLGIPALFCFGMYLWLSLIKDLKLQTTNGKPLETDWLQTTCRAGAIVLMVGFWFDGGLFKLATASTFWILLELGSVSNHEIHQTHENA